METNNTEKKDIKVVKLNNFISFELLRKMKEKEPNTKFILPNGKEAVLNDKKEQQKPSKFFCGCFFCDFLDSANCF